MPAEHEVRRARLVQILVDRELDAALITNLVNVRYLTGFTGSNGAAVLGADGSATLVTDGRYQDQSAQETPDVERVISRDLLGAMVAAGMGDSGRPVGIETHDLSVDAHTTLLEILGERAASVQSLERAVEGLRVVKDGTEIDALRRACDISVRALDQVHAGQLVGRTEREIARDLEWKMYELGAEAIAFDTIVASGPNSAIPHHAPTDRAVEPNELLTIDFGARVDGYHADCTRTVVVGRADDWQKEIYAAVKASQQAGVDALRGGEAVAESDARARAVLADAGWLDYFTTGLGHGVGLQIHEDPFISAKDPGKLIPRTALTMEPGIYVADRAGVRIEDTLVVTAGSPEVLTAATKDLLELA